jgi:hypothetical protein
MVGGRSLIYMRNFYQTTWRYNPEDRHLQMEESSEEDEA